MRFKSSSEDQTAEFARTLSLWARPGFVILLRGDLGSGKSTFARAFIKALASDPDFDVPSPTFSLVQTYDNTRIPVAHVDLYRLAGKEDSEEIGLSELVQSHVLLIEWPDQRVQKLSPNLLSLSFSGCDQARDAAVEAEGAWKTALSRNAEIEEFLKASGYGKAQRRFLDGDASFRRYETIIENDATLILMDMPQRPDGPPVKDGKPYSAIAHLAEGMVSVEAVNDQLFAMGYSVPEMIRCETSKGLALIEDLGSNVFGMMMRRGDNMEEPMAAAVEVLVDMALREWPGQVCNRNGNSYLMPSYDEAAQLIEVDLLPSWFHKHARGTMPLQSLHDSFEAEWRKVLPFTATAKPVWVLRDYHSPNLLWLPQRQGIQRVGLIDTQDALLGHPAYDLTSMLQDARVDVAFDFADRLYAHYVQLRTTHGAFDEPEFARAYAILGAQRATKIMGIFARLNTRDGKPAYIQHMPRVARYLARNLEHPDLADLKAWYETHLPEALAIGKTK